MRTFLQTLWALPALICCAEPFSHRAVQLSHCWPRCAGDVDQPGIGDGLVGDATCHDGVDNDGNGLVDLEENGCQLAVRSEDGWRWVSAPEFSVHALWGFAADDIWAAGAQPELMHWDGQAWTVYRVLVESLDYRMGLDAIWGAHPDDVWAGGYADTFFRWDGQRWAMMDPGFYVGAYSIWGFSADDAWAVGSQIDSAHWDGVRWQEYTTPQWIDLFDVWGAMPTEVWGVGRGQTSYESPVVRWDGDSWQVQSALDGASYLRGVHGFAEDDVWVVGHESSATAFHWDGSDWTPHPLPLTYAYAIWGLGPSQLWIGGDALLRWEGARWAQELRPEGGISAIWGTSAQDLWAGGAYGLHHWDGHFWEQRLGSMPPRTDAVYKSLWVEPSGRVWLVGNKSVDLWDGAGILHSFDTSACSLNAVWGSADDELWVVGDQGCTFRRLAHSWSQVESGGQANLRDVWTSGDEAWAVGSTLLHYSGGAWHEVDRDRPFWLNAVWGSAAGDVWAAGVSTSVLHWDGTAWSSTSSPARGAVQALWGSRAEEVWAVGDEILRWRATTRSWELVAPPREGRFAAVGGAPGGEPWVLPEGNLSEIYRWGEAGWRREELGLLGRYTAIGANRTQIWVGGDSRTYAPLLLYKDL